MVKQRECQLSREEAEISDLKQLKQKQMERPSSHVSVKVTRIELSRTRHADKPVAAIRLIIRNFLVVPIKFKRTDRVECYIAYINPNKGHQDIASYLDSVSIEGGSTIAPCDDTYVTAKFELPTATREELARCSDSKTPVKWEVIPNWEFVINSAAEFDVSRVTITYTEIPMMD